MKSNGNNMGFSEFYDGFVARRKAGEIAGQSFHMAVLQDHMLAAKLIEVGGDITIVDYVNFLAT